MNLSCVDKRNNKSESSLIGNFPAQSHAILSEERIKGLRILFIFSIFNNPRFFMIQNYLYYDYFRVSFHLKVILYSIKITQNRLRLSFFKNVRANCFCPSLLRTQIHATSSMSARALSIKINNDREDALPGFNDLGPSVTPTFLSRNRFYLQLSPHRPKMNKKSKWEVNKNSRFLSTGHQILPSC